MREGSVMDSLGVELIGVMSPVSICMLLVVLLVSALSPPPSAASATAPITAATLVYAESPSDPPARRLGGALLNAVVFVALVTAVTFLLVLLYYYNCTAFLRAYMRFSAFFVLASMGGSIFLSLLRRAALPLDAASALLLLLNFSALGVLAVLSPAVPILLRQSYTVSLGVIVAAWFTRLPEWTTWTLLLALALYDLVAVLSPRGPLKILVDLASSRDEELPALVYEARPTLPRPSPEVASIELQPANSPPPPSPPRGTTDNPGNSNPVHSIVEIEHIEEETDTSPLVANDAAARQVSQVDSSQRGHSSETESDDELFDSTRGIRLGLGDFVFYSVLVGRAAMYDLMTMYACYLAIISGLGCTLILLTVCRHALPALPISIALGMLFYFLTRLLMEPFVVGASTGLVMF